MKKKASRKHVVNRSVRKTGKKGHYVEFFGLGIGMLMGVFAIAGFHTADKPMVLGTSVLLAREGSESGQWAGSNVGSGFSGKEGLDIQYKEELLQKRKQELQRKQELLQKKERSNSGQPQKTFQTSGISNQGSDKQNIKPGTVVDCVSPEGQHVRQSFEACAALNKASNQSSFSFTVLKDSGSDKKQKMPPPESVASSGAITEKKPEEKRKEQEFLQKQRDKGLGNQEVRKLAPEESKQGVTEVREDNLDELNGKFEDKRIRFERNENNDFVLRKNNVKANTSFPVSVDPETNKLFITTPSGKKEVTVLPDAAVERILQNRILSAVETQASSSAVNGEDATSQTTLTELNSKPVFKVKGFSNKKVLGLFPASFAKTVYVSAEDGSVVKTDETFFSKMLETVSF